MNILYIDKQGNKNKYGNKIYLVIEYLWFFKKRISVFETNRIWKGGIPVYCDLFGNDFSHEDCKRIYNYLTSVKPE